MDSPHKGPTTFELCYTEVRSNNQSLKSVSHSSKLKEHDHTQTCRETEFLDYLGFKFSAHEKGFNTAKLRPARKQNVGQFLSSIIINMHSFLRVMTKL